ncbi:hypothetical protein CBS101457_004263 [Exobasidium rhododendri]|nr:hypothetical protein CBS101457_004263 [Exobasidium rhododendri]
MADGVTPMSGHFLAAKRHRVVRKGNSAPKIVESSPSPSSPPPTPSFPSHFLRSFSFKSEDSASRPSSEKYAASAEGGSRQRRKAVKQEDDNDYQGDAVRQGRLKRSRLSVMNVPEARDEEVEEKGELLPVVSDYIKEDIDILVIGSNPGRMSSRKGQHFSHPSNHFYRALHQSNLTPVRVTPDQDYTLVNQASPYFSIGLTNLVARPTRMAQELNKSEEAVGTEILIDLIRNHRPKVGIFVGIGVSRSFEKSLSQLGLLARIKSESSPSASVKQEDGSGRNVKVSVSKDIPLVGDVRLGLGVGLMNVGIRHSTGGGHTLLFSMPSTSGRVTTHQLKEKAESMAWARLLTSQLDKAALDCVDDSRHDISVLLI